MNDLLKEIKRTLRLHGLSPKRWMGQNFLVDEEVIEKLIDYASPETDETVLEIGAGLGFLTRRLAETCDRVVAVEADRRLARILGANLKRFKNVRIICGDIFKVRLPEFHKVVSTPPYNISSKLVLWLLKNRGMKLAVLTFQDEFARRLAAPVGSRDYGRLTVTAYYHAEVKALDKVPKTSFYPSPKVDSRITLIKPRPPPFKVQDFNLFSELVKSLFTQRKRKVRKGIMPFLRSVGLDKEDARELAKSIRFSEVRVKDLAPEDFGLLSDELSKKLEDHLL